MPKDNIQDVDFNDNFETRYYNYGIDVIEERALADVRDGLKPVQRAILIEMISERIFSSNKPAKGARITGAVIGKWHPHGDSSVESAMANMAAPWKNSMPAVKIHGNGGSIFGDKNAAGRYFEANLTPTGDAYGKNLNPGVVEYIPNFDETETMPKILPAQLPFLLINGVEGIAVGLASDIPTHNPLEVVEAFISYVGKPKQTVEQLMEILPGPDFPSYGEIINKDDLVNMYKTGNGKIRMRGKMRYDKKENAFHIYEIPYVFSGSMNNLVTELTYASMESIDKKGKKQPPKISGIADVKDHSGKDGIDIFIKLKRGVDPVAMEKEILAQTRLETTVKFNMTALNDKRLKKYNLKQYFKEYLAFQHEILTNEYLMEQKRLNKRMEIIKGLLILNSVIDEVISSAKQSKNKRELQEVLMTGKVLTGVDKKYHKTIKTFKFNEVQAEHIANLPIYKISKTDYQALVDEGKEVQSKIEYADGIINDVAKRKRLIISRHKTELKAMDKTEFARRTEIINAEFSTVSKLEIPETPLYFGYDKYQYVRLEEKAFDDSIKTTNKSRLGFLTNDGICWNLHLETMQPTKGSGTLVNQLLNHTDEIVGYTTQITSENESMGLFIYKDGNMKLTDMRKFMTKSKSTKVASGRTDVELMLYVDVPNDAVGITIDGVTFNLDDFSVNALGGRGKRMTSEYENNHIEVEFITDKSLLPKKRATKTPAKQAVISETGVAYFDGDDKLTFDWSASEPNDDHMFGINYEALLKSQLLFVHGDGTAKIIDGEQFKVSTKRTSIQANKKGLNAIYIGLVPKTMVAEYTSGVSKRVDTSLISKQGKMGGGVRAFYTTKHELSKVYDGADSTLECVSLATQPK